MRKSKNKQTDSISVLCKKILLLIKRKQGEKSDLILKVKTKTGENCISKFKNFKKKFEVQNFILQFF